MKTLASARRNVKATAILFTPAMTARLQNPAFGRMPQREF